jgi:hypothetical protein
MTAQRGARQPGQCPPSARDTSPCNARAGVPVLRVARRILGVSAVDGRGTGIDELAPAASAPPPAAALPLLSGFVESIFSPLAYEATRRCLSVQPGDSVRTAVVLASLMGDTTTTDLASQRLVAGRVHNPLLFMQATANSVLGYLSREFGITAQTLSLSTLDDPLVELLAMADLLLDDPELDRVLLVAVEVAGGARIAAVQSELADYTGRPMPAPNVDLAVAVLLGRVDPAPASGSPRTVSIRSMAPSSGGHAAAPADPSGPDDAGHATNTWAGDVAHHAGNLRRLLELALTCYQVRRDGGRRVLATDTPHRRSPTAFVITATTPAPHPQEGTDAQ